MTSSVVDRFVDRVDLSDPEGCWQWTGATFNTGYGKLSANGKRDQLAHRVAYEAFVAPIPKGLTIDHLCRTRLCVNPDHLEPVTNRENILRGTAPSARHAVATHCPRGHPYDDENTYVTPLGARQCRICRREYQRVYLPAWKARKRASQPRA